MARYKPVRQQRYEQLRKAGFLTREAEVLSKVKKSTPYLQSMIEERRAFLNKAIRQKLTVGEYERRIKLRYHANGWSEYGIQAGKRLLKFDQKAVYKMLRANEDRYKDKKPEYRSPWVKRQKQSSDFKRKFEKTFNQIPTQFND